MDFWGYENPDGSVGVRNYIAVIPASGCVNQLAWQIAKNMDNTVPILHNETCANIGNDVKQAFRVLAGIGKNPNVCSVLVVGLGCENISAVDLAEDILKSKKRVETILIKEIGSFDTAVQKGREVLGQMIEQAKQRERKRFDLGTLTLGVKCGGSDATSAIASNPVVGQVADRIIEEKGIVIISEVTEMIGAEHILARRAVNETVAKQIKDIVDAMGKRIKEMGVDIRGSEPSPANIEGGLTTLEEKSLGAIIKGGSTPIKGVLSYGQKPLEKGLFIMDGPARGAEVFAGFTAAGAQLSVVSMGGGLPNRLPHTPGSLGKSSVVPVLRIATLPHPEDAKIDFRVDSVIKGEKGIDEVSNSLLELITQTASGEKLTEEEKDEYTERFSIYMPGPVV